MYRIIKVTFFWLIGLFLISFIGSLLFPKISNEGLGAPSAGKSYSYYLSLAQWDGGNYLEIAQNGYTSSSFYAFSPMYPFLIKSFSSLTSLDLILSGLAVSLASFFGFLYFFYLYIKNVYGKKQAQNAVLTFLFFPTAFFCALIYSESLFLFILAFSLYALTSKMYKFSVIASSLLPLVRYVGVFLIVGNTLALIREKKDFKLVILHTLSSLPLTVYAFVLYLIFNNPLLFVSTQNVWSRFSLDPLSTLFLYVVPLASFKIISSNNLLDLSVTLLFTAVLVASVKKLPLNLWLFSVLAILIPASTGTLTGMPRYALASLGFFAVAGGYLGERPTLKLLVWSMSLALQCLLFSLFVTGHWVA